MSTSRRGLGIHGVEAAGAVGTHHREPLSRNTRRRVDVDVAVVMVRVRSPRSSARTSMERQKSKSPERARACKRGVSTFRSRRLAVAFRGLSRESVTGVGEVTPLDCRPRDPQREDYPWHLHSSGGSSWRGYRLRRRRGIPWLEQRPPGPVRRSGPRRQPQRDHLHHLVSGPCTTAFRPMNGLSVDITTMASGLLQLVGLR
jgi:hypothetical protein